MKKSESVLFQWKRVDLNFKFKMDNKMSEEIVNGMGSLGSRASQTSLSLAKIDDPTEPIHSSTEILEKIYKTLNSTQNHYPIASTNRIKKSEESIQTVVLKCNCKKSKCLKLYCECFAQGLLCDGCNCEGCQNTEQFGEVRAKAIDEVMGRSILSFGHKSSLYKGCNCKKTGCLKKYCECFGSGQKCNEYCKCSNCLNV